MFDTSWIADLDAASACQAITGIQVDLCEIEWRELALAAHWADLHDDQTVAHKGSLLAGLERAVRLGGDGTPLVAEFACAELGVLMGTSPATAENLIRDALDLRHRHPRLWAALAAGNGRVWKARKVAHLTHDTRLTLDQARAVDAAVAPYVDSLPFGRLVALTKARIIEADPAAAEARQRAEALERFVRTGQSDEYGLKTLIVKANAGDVIFMVAMCDRIAQASPPTGTVIWSTYVGRRRSGSSPNPPSRWRCCSATSSSTPTNPTPTNPTPTNPTRRRQRRKRSRSTSTSSAPPRPCSSGSARKRWPRAPVSRSVAAQPGPGLWAS
ncbi:MAG: hypothetical protein ABIO66_07470 [Nocardioidaceae bacterium]